MYRTNMKKLLSLLTVFAMVFGMIAVVQPVQANAATVETPISNGDFENGAFGGAVNGSNGASIVEKATYEGNYALKFDATGEILTVTGYLSEATTAESSVTLSFWAKVLSGSTGNSVNFGLFATNASWGNRVQKYGAGYPVVGGDWKQISQTLTVPAETKIIQAQIYLGSEGTTAIVDNISITDGSGKEILTSGGFEKGALNGDFNANDALEIVCTPVHSGSYAAHADKSSGNGNISTTVSIEPSSEARTMQFSYWMYAPTSVNSAHNMVVCFDTSSGSWTNLSTKYGAQYATPGTWVQKTIDIAVAANTNTLQIQLYAQDAGADFYIDDMSLTEEVADIVNHEAVIGLNQVTGDGTWQMSLTSETEIPATYYKIPATIDGTKCNILAQYNGSILIIYPNFFPALGGAVPTSQIIIEEGAVLKAVDSAGGWAEVDGAATVTVTQALDLSYVDGAWGITVPNQDVAMELASVQNDGTWQFYISTTPANKYYKVPAIIDGVACSFLMGESGGLMCVYPSFFTVGGSVPAKSLVIEAGAVMKPVDSTAGWAVIQGAETLTITNTLTIENNLGVWQDMSQYADVDFINLTAADLSVYRAEDQAESNYRSVFAIAAGNGIEIGNAGWGNFYKVAAKVLVDGVETSAVFGMVPADDEGWGNASAFLLYITGEGNWDAATAASSVTICAGTMIMPSADATYGFKFTEDFTMYKNCDGTWDTTADTHVYNQQNTELEGALASEANCQSAAAYYYSCACGQLGNETFSSGELGGHSFANGSCSVCGQAAQSITISFQTVAADGTWQLIPSAAPANKYYKIPAIIDGTACNVLAGYSSNMLLIYPNFFTALGGAVPTESFVIPAGTVLKAMESDNGWTEIEDAAVLIVTDELKIENVYDKWYEMSKYADVTFTEIYAADLDMYYYNILRLGDYSDAQIAVAKLQYPEYADLIEYYGRDANMTTFGIKSTIPTLQIPNHDSWPNFQLIGKISVDGAEPWETYVMQTPSSAKEDSETAMDNAFLVRFYNDFVGDQAVSISIEPGTRIVTADGTAGFVFVDGYTLYRDSDGNWSEEAPEGTNPVNKWGLTLGDQIGVKFEVKAGMNVSFAVNGNAVDAVQNGNIYTIYLAAAQMNDVITVSVDGVAQEKTYSVRGYADIILNDDGYGEQTYNLVKTMLVYGGAAQSFFNHNASDLASDGIEVTAAVPTGDGEIQLSDDLKGFAFYGATLMHQDKIAVRLYFSGSTEGLTFTANGGTVNAVTKGDLHYVEISGINPQNLGEDVVVVVTDGTDSLTVSYSPLDYMVRMYNKEDSSEATKALVQALYGYYLAAVDYTA